MSYSTVVAFVSPGDPKPETPSWESIARWFTVFGPAKRAQLQNYWELTREYRETMEMAAVRLDRSMRTVWRYEMDIRAALEVTS